MSEAVAEPPKSWLFTSENAAEMAHKAHAARKILKEALRNTIDTITQATAEDTADDYTQRRLIRVRLHLDAVDAEIANCVRGDSKRLKELVETQNRLNSQERELSMRPAPGTTKPTAPKGPKASAFAPPPPADDISPG